MLIGGADVSGSKGDGQQSHAASVIGREGVINRVYNDIGISPIHMSEMSERRRNQVHRHPDFSSNEITAWRFHINRRYIENAVQERIIVRKKRGSRESIFTKVLNRTGSGCSGTNPRLLRPVLKRFWAPLKRMRACAVPSKIGILTTQSGERRTSWPMRWRGLTKRELIYKTAKSRTYETV